MNKTGYCIMDSVVKSVKENRKMLDSSFLMLKKNFAFYKI